MKVNTINSIIVTVKGHPALKNKLKKISKHKECPMLDQLKKIDKIALFAKFDLFYMSNFHFLKKGKFI